jgi:hypothetical protein
MRTPALISVLVLSTGAVFAQDISTPQKRMATLDVARTLLTTQPLIEGADKLEKKNPFNVKTVVVEVTATTPTVVTTIADRDRLIALAPLVAPSGSLQLGDKSMLLFGQKRLKVGDSIPIVFQGVTYDLQISAIERTTFTLRLNNEEITRPIKPVVTKP